MVQDHNEVDVALRCGLPPAVAPLKPGEYQPLGKGV